MGKVLSQRPVGVGDWVVLSCLAKSRVSLMVYLVVDVDGDKVTVAYSNQHGTVEKSLDRHLMTRIVF